MINNYSEKYNIILGILLFAIPMICLNASYFFITSIKIDLAKKEQEKYALREVETLAYESNFANYFASKFVNIFENLKNDANYGFINTPVFEKTFNSKVNKILNKPFPQKYTLYLFKIASGTQQTHILYSIGDKKAGDRALCKAIEQLYYTNIGDIKINKKDNPDRSFSKNLLGKFTDINIIAKEMRGLPTHINGIYKYSWFIWDYFKVDFGIYAGFLVCDQNENWELAGYKNALNELKKRGKAIGAFLPLYKEFGEPILQYPLDKSKIFLDWANTITIQNEKNINHWLSNSLPKKVKLGNYTAYLYLARGASYISVILVKTLQTLYFPKWLISLDLFLFISLFLLLYFVIILKKWPNFSLKIRFVLSYTLASVLPISFLCVIAYGYLINFQKILKTKLLQILRIF